MFVHQIYFLDTKNNLEVLKIEKKIQHLKFAA